MDTIPMPISPYTINLILHYISPPSHLTRPIPSSLLSRSLLQRHALLDISPQDTTSYLSWPSPGRDRAIQHLESLPMPLDELAPDLLVGYTVDPEHSYAHVHVKSTGDDGLRLVFEWDGEESWKYHDSNVMPFPTGARSSLDDTVAGAASVPIPVPELGEDNQDKVGDAEGDSDDDDYWNSYDAEDDSGTQLLPSTSKSETDASEDAYWARYASVQGTADSTIPSPVHKKTRRLEAVPVAHHEEIIPTLNTDILSRRLHDSKTPPSPSTLAHQLTALSPRRSNTSPYLVGLPEPDPEEDTPGATDDDTESPSLLPDDETPWEWGAPQANRKERTVPSTVAIETASSSSHQETNENDDGRALEDALRGLFWLWKTRRESHYPPGRNDDKRAEELERADFLQLVGRAIAMQK